VKDEVEEKRIEISTNAIERKEKFTKVKKMNLKKKELK